MDDLISRRMAIEQVLAGKLSDDSFVECVEECNSMIEWAVDVLKNLPSAQPDCSDCIKHGGDWDCDHVHCHKGRLPSAQPAILACGEGELNVPDTNVGDTISRQAAIDALADYIHNVDKVMGTGHLTADDCKDAASSVLEELPSAQQEPQWIPVKSRPMDDEERKEWSEKVGYELEGDDAVIYTSQLPEDGQECIFCTKWGNVFIDTFQNDPDYGCAFEEHGDMDGITAWMPLPKPWKGEKDETD